MVTLVRIGEEEAAVYVVSDTELQFTAPAGAAIGTVDVTVVTDAGEATLADSFEYVDEPRLAVIVPDGGGSTIDVPYDTATIYVTRLQNFGTEATDVTDTVTLHSEGGALAAADIVLESEVGGGGSWTVESPVESGGDLVLSDVLTSIAANTDNRGRMRITVADTVTDLTGTSTLTDSDDTVLATTTYTFNLTGGA